jgi:hypothetical protein
MSFLADAVGTFPVVPQVAGAPAPKHATDAAGYLALVKADAAQVEAMLRNKVKKCSGCGKPNAYSLAKCNGCGAGLADTAVSFTTNVFVGFIVGLQRGPFPFTISIRQETERFIVFDDLLALSPLHFNVIPAQDYLPDWRYLLRAPAAGLRLIRELYGACVDTAAAQFTGNAEWVGKLCKAGAGHGAEHFTAGFNYPPSQYQLHIQFMSPVVLPFQYHLYEEGVHFTPGRFFPYEYVVACLEAAERAAPPAELLRDDAPVEAIAAHFLAAHKVDYAAMHAACTQRFAASHALLADWQPADFNGVVTKADGKLVYAPANGAAGAEAESVDVTALVARDKAALQNYGRPYAADGKTTGSFYSFARDASELNVW